MRMVGANSITRSRLGASSKTLTAGMLSVAMLVAVTMLLGIILLHTPDWGDRVGSSSLPTVVPRRFLLQEAHQDESTQVDTSGIYDSDSELKVKITNARMMGLGNDEIHDFKFFMKVRDMGFFHESKFGAGNRIKAHAHKGDILNFVLDGSVNINGKTYSKGDWYLVTKNTRYSGAIGPHGARALMFCSFAEETGDSAHIEAWVYHGDRKRKSSLPANEQP